jgi:hypothetical protein
MTEGFRNRISKIVDQVLGEESYFASCPRDEKGRCEPGGGAAGSAGPNARQVAALSRRLEVLRSKGPAEDDGSGAVDRFRGYVAAYKNAIRALSASKEPWDVVVGALDDAAHSKPRTSDGRGQERRSGYAAALVDLSDELSVVK